MNYTYTYKIKVKDNEIDSVLVDNGKKHFVDPVTKRGNKIYLVGKNGLIHYVGITKQSMSSRIRGNWGQVRTTDFHATDSGFGESGIGDLGSGREWGIFILESFNFFFRASLLWSQAPIKKVKNSPIG